MNQVRLTNDQKEILMQFKANLADILTSHHTDRELLKWVRAKNFDLKKSEKNFRQVDMYRRLYNIEKINEFYVKPKVAQEYERTCFLGYSKDGTPIRYAKFNADIYGFVQSLSQCDMSLYFINIVEGDIKLARKENIKTGQDNTSIVYIFDLDGYNFQDLSYKSVIETSIEYIRLVQDFYPEIWRYILVINAPYIFYKIMHIFKPVLRNTFIDRVKIASKGTTPNLLKKYIDDDFILTRLGGKKVDSKGELHHDEEFINPYGKIPEEYHLKNSMHLINESDPGVKVVNIRAKSCFNISRVFKEAGNRLRIEFRTENGAINLVTFYRSFGDSNPENPDLPETDEYLDPDDENSLLAVEKIKCQSHIAPNDRAIIAVWPGIYIFQFDNTGSWFGSRKLYYRLTVSSPEP